MQTVPAGHYSASEEWCQPGSAIILVTGVRGQASGWPDGRQGVAPPAKTSSRPVASRSSENHHVFLPSTPRPPSASTSTGANSAPDQKTRVATTAQNCYTHELPTCVS